MAKVANTATAMPTTTPVETLEECALAAPLLVLFELNTVTTVGTEDREDGLVRIVKVVGKMLGRGAESPESKVGPRATSEVTVA